MLPRPDGKIWAEAGRRAAEELGIPLSAFPIGPHVAWRSRSS